MEEAQSILEEMTNRRWTVPASVTKELTTRFHARDVAGERLTSYLAAVCAMAGIVVPEGFSIGFNDESSEVYITPE